MLLSTLDPNKAISNVAVMRSRCVIAEVALMLVLGGWLTPGMAVSALPTEPAAPADTPSGEWVDPIALNVANLRNRACAGDVSASAAIGRLYLFGNGTFERDLSRAMPFLRYSGERGNNQAAADYAISLVTASREPDILLRAAEWAKFSVYRNPTYQSMQALQLVKLAAKGVDLSAGLQAGARRAILANLGTVPDGEVGPCRSL